MELQSKRMQTDFKVNYLVPSTLNPSGFCWMQKLDIWELLGVSWSKETLKDLATMKSCKGILTKEVQSQICQLRDGAGHREISVFSALKNSCLVLYIDQKEGLDWDFCNLFFSWFPTTPLREGFKYFSAHYFAFNTSFIWPASLVSMFWLHYMLFLVLS